MSGSPLAASAYEVLRVTPDATDDELRRAYRLRLREAHPDTGGDAALFVRVQAAWELVGTPAARAAYDRGRGGASVPHPTFAPEPTVRSRPADTRPGPRSHGQPGGYNRERYLVGVREWAGRGVTLADPYDPALVRSAPRELRRLLADALAEENTARSLSDLGMGYTIWHDVAVPRIGGKLDHVVLGPSGLFALTSDDYAAPVKFRRGEVIGEGVDAAPVGATVAAARALGKAAGVRFGGVIVVLPDADVPEQITELGRVRSLAAVVVGRGALTTALRRGVTGVRDLGGTEIFDVRTRLQAAIRFV